MSAPGRTCADFEALLCDWLDGVLPPADRASLEAHLEACPACAESARDVRAAAEFLHGLPAVEPPAELVNRILFQSPAGHAEPNRRLGLVSGSRRSAAGWLRGLFAPILQPRFAMGMAMTILSFSMIGRFAGIPERQLSAADLNPVKIWATFDDKVHRAWDRAVKYYESLRVVLEIQSRLQEWSAEEGADRRATPAPRTGELDPGAPPPEAAPGPDDNRR